MPPSYAAGVAACGASPLPLNARLVLLAEWCVTRKASPPKCDAPGSTTQITALNAIAASIKVPPCLSIEIAALTANGWLAAAPPLRA